MSDSRWSWWQFVRGDRPRRVGLILLTAAPLGVARFLATGHGAPSGFPGWACPLRALTGIPCPGCGLTRSFVAIAGGQWQAAFEFHALGPLLFGGLGVFALLTTLELLTQRTYRLPWLGSRFRRYRLQMGLVSVLIVGAYYLGRLAWWGHQGELSLAIATSPLGQWLGLEAPAQVIFSSPMFTTGLTGL